MAIDVTMPQMGESVVEGTIARWLVKEGDEVREDQPLVEISTDKVDTEIPSPGAGIIARIVVHEGETVGVGTKIAEISAAGATATASSQPSPANVEPALTPQPTPVPQPRPAAVASQPIETASAAEEAVPISASHDGNGDNAPSEDGPRRYSPVVLKMAAEYHVNLERVPGSGTGGRITKRDLVKYLEGLGHKDLSPAPPPASNGAPRVAAVATTPPPTPRQSAPAAAAAPTPIRPVPLRPATTSPAAPSPGAVFRPPLYDAREGDIVEPFTRRRKLIAEHMVYSKTHSPHVGTVAEIDLSAALALREAHKDEFRRREGFALTLLPLAAAATVRALREFPRMNASVTGDTLVIRKDINLGIAMDDAEGLLVPVIKAAEGMSVTGIAREIERLRKKIAEKQIAADDLAGGSFTLSNPGREGNLYGFAIINQPQVGILRMGEIKKRPVVIESGGGDAIAIRPMMHLALSYDHRVVDGVLGNRFLFRVARLLEEADFEL